MNEEDINECVNLVDNSYFNVGEIKIYVFNIHIRTYFFAIEDEDYTTNMMIISSLKNELSKCNTLKDIKEFVTCKGQYISYLDEDSTQMKFIVEKWNEKVSISRW